MSIYEPINVFGLAVLEVMALSIILSLIVFGLFCLWRYRQAPYRVIMKSDFLHKERFMWALERRTDFLLGEWELVFESIDKHEIQTKARQALLSHYRFRDFINERNCEQIQGDMVTRAITHKKVSV